MTPEKFYDQMKDYYCIVENQRQADELHRLCKEVCPDIIKGNIDLLGKFNYFMIVKSPIRTLTNDSNIYYDAVGHKIFTTELSYSEMVTKIKSLNMKTKKCHKVNNKCELVAAIAYLKEYFKENEVELSMHGIESFMLRSKIIFPYLVKGGKYTFAGQDQQYDCENVSLEEFAKYLVESTTNNKKYDLGNGLEAKYNKSTEHITIGCKTKPKGYFENLANNIISLDESFSFGGFKFEIEDAKEFVEWLRSL